MADLSTIRDSADEFLLVNEQHRAFLSGKSKQLIPNHPLLTAISIVMLSLFGVVAFALSISAINDGTLARALQAQGTYVRATITALEEESDGDSSDYFITYRYRVGEMFYSNRERIPSKLYRQWEVNDAVDIRALPENPATAELVEAPRSKERIFTVLAAVLWGMLSVIIAVIVQSRRVAAEFNNAFNASPKEGQLLIGEITAYEQSKDSEGSQVVRYAYRYTLPNGDEVAVPMPAYKTALPRGWVNHASPPGVGSKVVIAYLNNGKTKLL